MTGDGSNPYQPPGSDPGRAIDPHRRGHPLKAIVFGAVADLGGTILMAIVVSTLFATMLVANGHPADAIADLMIASKLYMAVLLTLGLGLDVVGGYVAARIANHAEYKHAILTAVLVVIGGTLLGSGSDDSGWPAWIDVAGNVLVFPAALFGAYLYLLEKYRARPAA